MPGAQSAGKSGLLNPYPVDYYNILWESQYVAISYLKSGHCGWQTISLADIHEFSPAATCCPNLGARIQWPIDSFSSISPVLNHDTNHTQGQVFITDRRVVRV